jgi:glycosyltransferase involved in cell wall biosynthesis
MIAQDAPATLRVGDARACVIVPAYQASRSLRAVIEDLHATLPCSDGDIIVVDDGSTDGTADVARAMGASVVVCARNGGKGAALARGLEKARSLGFGVALSVDADGQHPARGARALLDASDNPLHLVLGIRDLVRDGAPRKNQLSNGISNLFLSLFARQALRDTQCGLRRYPIRETLALGARATGYAFEAEVILRAIAAGMTVVEQPVVVIYPPEHERVTHFDGVRDPMRIIATVVRTLYDLKRAQ